MLNQENLYQLIFKKQWTDILSLFYTNKKDIANDTMLQQAAITFEQEFFKNIQEYSIERKDIEANLEILYTLHHGKFYLLSDDNFKKLILELVKRKPVSQETAGYAGLFPDEEICKIAISNYEKKKIQEQGFKLIQPLSITMNWIEIYNRLFELINIQGDSATYFTGSRFINTVREIEPYFPDYSQFIEQRNREGKSTSRKIFYYDILIGLKEESRLKVVDRILAIEKPFQKEKVEKIEDLLGSKIVATEVSSILSENDTQKPNNPVVFISYSWDDEEHKDWVLNLANLLCSDGIDVILDRYELRIGKSLPHFVENSIARAEKIIIVFTPNYKLKADKRTGGVGYEYSIMNMGLYENQTSNEKIIPILRKGDLKTSIPVFMQQFIHLDVCENENFENSYKDLLREIYGEPAIVKPIVGTKPNFEKHITIEVEKPKLGEKPKLKDEVLRNINPNIISGLTPNETFILTLSNNTQINAGIIRKEDEYVVHYTGRGIREIFKPDLTENEQILAEELRSQSEEYLVENGYVAYTPYYSIIDINR